jgi:hypothetical protein
VVVELIGSDGIVHAYELNAGGSNTAECSVETVGLTLADGKRTLAGLQDHLVRAQTQEYYRQRRLCSHCGSQWPLKDVRARWLLSVFGPRSRRHAFALPVRGDAPSYAQSRRRDHSRSMHARIRAHHRGPQGEGVARHGLLLQTSAHPHPRWQATEHRTQHWCRDHGSRCINRLLKFATVRTKRPS